MLVRPLQSSILAGFAAFGAIGASLALVGVGVPFLPAALAAAVAAGLVQHLGQHLGQRLARPARPGGTPRPTAEDRLREQLEEYRAHSAVLRHDLRGVLSPALMMSDRLLGHADPAVQRAGNAVVRSIERATTLLASSKEVLQPVVNGAPSADGPAGPVPPGR